MISADAAALADPAFRLSIAASGVFFGTGLLTGVWKYLAIARTPRAQAPAYVDIAHRASLLYSFAALLIAQFARLSAWSPLVNLWAAAAPLAFFALAILGYVIHGWLDDTDNQLRAPQAIGRFVLPRGALPAFMFALMGAELGGFCVLFAGVLKTLALY